MAPSLRVAAKNRPYFVVALVLGITKPCGLRLVWAVFRSQRRPPEVVLTGPSTAGLLTGCSAGLQTRATIPHHNKTVILSEKNEIVILSEKMKLSS